MESKNTRKACDLCYRKRIKCDGQQPRCSNCQTYLCACTHEAASRKKKKKKKKTLKSPTNHYGKEKGRYRITPPEIQDVHVQQPQVSPLGPLHQGTQQEQGIDAYLLAEGHETARTPTPDAFDDQPFQESIESGPLLSCSPAHAPTSTSAFTPISSGQPRKLQLPSEKILRHAIDVYLATFNSVLPLFDPQCLYQIVNDWYREPSNSRRIQHQPSSWATINIVLALAQCHGHGHLSSIATQAMSLSECLNNAQSVVTDILSEEMDLQHIQILLGLGILFLGARPDDVRAATTFVSTAVRLAQAMGLHRRDYYNYEITAPSEIAQRKRVFWIAYILDRDVAARTRQAPIQQDADMDLDLPQDNDTRPFNVGNHSGGVMSTTTNAGTGFSLFRARAELAQIQSRVYDCALSVRAAYRAPGDSSKLATGIRLSIQQWKARLPAALKVDALVSSAQSDSDENSLGVAYLPAAMSYMQSLVIMCLGQLCRVNSMDFHWIEDVLSYARGIGKVMYDTKTTFSLPCTSGPPSSTLPFASFVLPPPPPPQGWKVLVSECRDLLRLFQSIRNKHPTFINVQLCPFGSSLLCLSVNSFLDFEGDGKLNDQRLLAGAAEILGQLKEQAQSEIISKVLDVYSELDWYLMLLTVRF